MVSMILFPSSYYGTDQVDEDIIPRIKILYWF